MPTALTLEDHLAEISREGDLLADLAERTDHTAAVPSCPGWTLRDLIAHQGEVHRWATDIVTGQWDELSDADKADRVAAPLDPALVGWFRDGAADLVDAITAAPDSLQTPIFLLSAPPARHFWARRQANETTMHRVDALSANLGRLPSAAETGITRERALDGIDELLTGFIPRPRAKLRNAAPYTVAVEPTDSDRRWVLAVSDGPVVTTESDAAADATFRGTTVEVYLALWNRGTEMVSIGRAGIRDQWREQVRVQWH